MSSNVKPLNPCPMCKGEEKCIHLEDGKYKYYCDQCGQSFELTAPSQLVADMIYNSVIARE